MSERSLNPIIHADQMGKPRGVRAQLLSFMLSVCMVAAFPAEQQATIAGSQNGLPDRRCLQPASLEKAALVLDEYDSQVEQLGTGAEDNVLRTSLDIHDGGDISREEEMVSASVGESSSSGEGGRGVEGAFYNASAATSIPDFGDVLSILECNVAVQSGDEMRPQAGAWREKLPRRQGRVQKSTDLKGEERRRAKRAQRMKAGSAAGVWDVSEFAQSQMRKMGFVSGQVRFHHCLNRNADRQQGCP